MGGYMKDVPVKSRDEGIEVMRQWLLSSPQGYAHSFLMDNGGVLFVRQNTGQPCQGGEMRTYSKGSSPPNYKGDPNCTRPSDPRPGDLITPFPDGTPIAVAVPLGYRGNQSQWNALFEDVVFNADVSPWRKVLKDFELIAHKGQPYSGCIILDTDVDSTAMVALFRKINNGGFNRVNIAYNAFVKREPKRDKRELFIAAAMCENVTNDTIYIVRHTTQYGLFGGGAKLKDVWDGNFIDLTGGTFKQRAAYNRPKIDYLWPQGDKLDDLVAKRLGGEAQYGYSFSINKLPEYLSVIESCVFANS